MKHKHIARPLVCADLEKLDFCVGLNENANSSFATRCRFWSGKNISFPGNACKQSSSELTNTALNEIDQSPQISVTQRGLEKWIVWESLSHFYFNEIKKFTFTVNKMYCTIFIFY